ncbi:coatomer protein [Mycena leptocephala]|nr:coatomer protein [Mycena leptocephala]
MASSDSSCYTIVQESSAEYPSHAELRQALEKGSDAVKIDTLRKIIISTINGNSQPNLIMPIIQYVLPSPNKQLKKLLHFYWEVCPKYDENGKLKQEMILVQHPNEYIRGATLRFLEKIAKDAELLEPLIPTCRSCLEHRHGYVRKNAVFALMSTFLAAESDSTCKRNAFVFLAHCSMPKAVEYILSIYDSIPALDEALQMSIIEVIRLDCKNDSAHRARYIRCMFELLNVPSYAVKYEAATTLTTLTQNPAAVKAAASSLINIVIKESDNNVKIIVLDRLDSLRARHGHVLDGLIMDVLQVLSSADMDVRRKAISIVLSMTTSRNVEEVVLFLKKQLQKTQETEFEKAPEYRQLLIQSIHVTAIKFSEVAASVVHALMDFLGDSNNPSALDVVSFVREVVEKFPHLRTNVTNRLIEKLNEIKSGKYIESVPEIQSAMQEIRKVLGEIPILASEQKLLDDVGTGEEEAASPKVETGGGKPKVLADGTYATETAYSTTTTARLEAVRAASKPPLRTLLLGGDFFTGSVLASALTKLVLRFAEKASDKAASNMLRAESMLIMTSIIRVGQSKFATVQIDEDSNERIMNCIKTLSELETENAVQEIFLADTKTAFSRMLGAQEVSAYSTVSTMWQSLTRVDLQYDEDVGRATAGDVHEDFISNLSRISQLTGFSDPIYAEAYVKMHGFDIMLDVLLVNQTANTMQNLCLDFATLGDLKIVERPSVYTIAPHGFQSIKATIKACVILNDIHIDIMDYIKPAYCNEAQFRSMWTEFEWENRVNVDNQMSYGSREYLAHVMKATNMSCLTPEGATSGDCDFLSANMYARSLFGEDALANLSVERTAAGTITGHVRIRSKTQGIALSLGDRITMAQKSSQPVTV